ncbi:hypothetical protein BRADI_2g57532v3 [Brachypodium distachyon]|uniref:Uncharacterized protein n=1 Tax=Brachypodium distachyon TaxID=15368 RepID=A0A0Q3RCV2_BRADI|nr:hypothetical protein BRADI_2g57532v3 [Brachypodium distachyon]
MDQQKSVPRASSARAHGQHLHQRRHQRGRRARRHGPRRVGAPHEARGHDRHDDEEEEEEGAAARVHGLDIPSELSTYVRVVLVAR